MKVIRGDPDLDQVKHDEVRRLIDARIREAVECVDHLVDLVFFVVIEPGDGPTVADDTLGFALMSNRFDGTSFGDPEFTPSWDVIEEHQCCFELVFVLSDDGSGVMVFVMKEEGAPGAPTLLLEMCSRYTTKTTAEGVDR